MKRYLFDVRLLGVEDPPWRRFLLDERATFGELHGAIQDACGWEDQHLFAFRTKPGGRLLAGLPFDDEDSSTPDAEKVRLASYFPEHASCLYVYDFGDDWQHEVRLLEIAANTTRHWRRLVDGARAFPPEDCGSLPGYEDCLAVAQGRAPRYHGPEFVEWLGRWDPDGFDLEAARKEFDE